MDRCMKCGQPDIGHNEAICQKQQGATKLEIELGRWQDEIRNAVIRLSGADDGQIDGGGCESGDPLDFTLAEIELGFAHLDDKLRERIAELEAVLYRIANDTDDEEACDAACAALPSEELSAGHMSEGNQNA